MLGAACPGLAAAVVVGGESRRMGQAKAFLELAGTPLIEWVLAALRPLTAAIQLIGDDRAPYAPYGLPHHGDLLPGGALAGIHSAIHHSGQPYTLVVACDMPYLNVDLLRAMAEQTKRGQLDVIVPTVAGYPQGLHAIYHRRCLAAIERRLRADRRRVIGFYPEVAVDYWDESRWQEYDPAGRSFINLNTPEELDAARSRLDRCQERMEQNE